jgi:CheY-like chemotaxis protein
LPDRILVADDELDILNLTRRILEKNGLQVVTAVNGEEALLKAEAEMPNLVLLDLVMPGKSGLEVCKILKAQCKTKHVPVVMFTSLGRDVDRKLSAEAGADGHFTKPFTPEGLMAEVTSRLEKGRGEKFSEQLGVTHKKLQGRKILLEFDPSTPYERLVRDFALECVSHNEVVIALTKRGSVVRQAVEGEKGVELFDVTPDLMLSPILEKYRETSLGLIYDNLTDLALSTNPQTSYKFASSCIGRLFDPRITAIFLLNPTAHDQKDIYSLKGLFSSQVTYGKQGVTSVKIT